MTDDEKKQLADAPEPAPETLVIGAMASAPELGTPLARATSAAIEAGKRLATEFRDLDRSERAQIVRAFRSQLIPRGRPGRRRTKRITAAHADWKSGMRGIQLHRRHILGFDRMSQWRRRGKIRALMDAIRSRERRARKRERTKQAVSIEAVHRGAQDILGT
jgi:hypothetical protein